MNRSYFRRSVWLLLILTAFFAGCNTPKSDLKKFNKYFKAECLKGSDLEKSAAFAKSKVGKGKKPKAENLLWAMQMGCLERIRQNHRESTEYFDRSEEMLKYFDYQNKAVDSAAAIAVSDNVVPYLGEEYDGIMVNTYKALSFMVLGQEDLARVEFNRALDRQRIATEKFAKELQKLKKEIDQQQKKEKSQVKRNVENPKVRQAIEKKYPGLYEFEAYADFVNPFTTYIAGVFFNLVGDHSKAAPLLKQSYGMVSDNEYIAEDLAVTERILDGQEELKNTLWVIFENGLGPIKKEFRVDLPLFLVTSKVKYVGIALPKLAFREQAYPYLSIKATENNCTTQLVADMDRVVQTEFSKDFQGILTRAIISATAKALTQYAFEEAGGEGGAIASIVFAVYSFATTAADVRIWTTLPKDFQVARLPIPDDRLVTITPPGAPPLEVKISPCKNAVLYVRIPFKQARPVYDLITY